MKYSKSILAFILILFVTNINAQIKKDKYIESDVISLQDRTGFSWQTKKGDFKLKPYMLVFSRAQFNYVDDEGLNLAEVDNIVNTGFAIPKAVLGFAGQAYEKITFNFTIDAAASGAALLNQAWFDVNFKDEFRVRVGKFKTPMNRAYQVRLGQSLFPCLPSSLTTRVNLPYTLNSVNPIMSTGFDLGVMAHGFVMNQFLYQVGIFNGTGITQNKATNTTSDDMGIPSLLYSARVNWMPMGKMPLHEGDPSDVNNMKVSIGPSVSYNVEANYESSDDLRVGLDFAMHAKRLYVSGEAYMLNMGFVERQRTSEAFTFLGAYAQAGYMLKSGVQPVARIDYMDRNSTDKNGALLLPSIGLNYFMAGQNLKLQAMYQTMMKVGYDNDVDANDDDNGLSEHKFILQVQFSF